MKNFDLLELAIAFIVLFCVCPSLTLGAIIIVAYFVLLPYFREDNHQLFLTTIAALLLSVVILVSI